MSGTVSISWLSIAGVSAPVGAAIVAAGAATASGSAAILVAAAIAGAGLATPSATSSLVASAPIIAAGSATPNGSSVLMVGGASVALVAAGLARPAGASVLTVSGPALASTVTLPLTTDGVTPAANLSGLRWAFFDQVNPGAFAAPTARGAAGATDGSGILVVSIAGTALAIGAVGWLIVSDSDGTTTQNPAASAFSGPVTVA